MHQKIHPNRRYVKEDGRNQQIEKQSHSNNENDGKHRIADFIFHQIKMSIKILQQRKNIDNRNVAKPFGKRSLFLWLNSVKHCLPFFFIQKNASSITKQTNGKTQKNENKKLTQAKYSVY